MGSDNYGPSRRPAGGGRSFFSPTQILRDVIMVFIGIAVALHYRAASGQQSASSDTSSSAEQQQVLRSSSSATSTNTANINLPDGWHPINVYYGSYNLLTDDIPEKWRVVGVPKNSQEGISKEWFGQHGQDVAIAKFFNFKKDGYFVDLASNDAVWASNTFALETNYGWKGICIEPNPYYWFRLSFRKCHALGAMVGEKNLDEVKVQLSYSKVQGPYGGIVGDKFDNKKESKDAERRYTASLQHIFETFEAPKVIDYISLDVEGAEEFIMGHFPFDRYRFLTMTIERPKDELRKLLESNGYKHVLDFKRGDTLWAHESVYDEGKALVEKNRNDIDSHIVADLPA